MAELEVEMGELHDLIERGNLNYICFILNIKSRKVIFTKEIFSFVHSFHNKIGRQLVKVCRTLCKQSSLMHKCLFAVKKI